MEKQPFVVMIDTENKLDILNRITTAYFRRNVEIEQISGAGIPEGGSRVTIHSVTRPEVIDQIVNQIGNIVEVKKVACFIVK